jgi:hypothetical protein
MKRIETQVDLPAEPWVVWEQLVDTASIGSWNPFITSLSGLIEVGERLQVRVAPVGGRPMTFKPRVTVVEPARRLEWLGTMGVPGLFDGRHSFTLTPVGEGCRLVQAEEFSGAFIPLTGRLLSRTEAGFEAMNAALLSRLERDQPTTSRTAEAL